MDVKLWFAVSNLDGKVLQIIEFMDYDNDGRFGNGTVFMKRYQSFFFPLDTAEQIYGNNEWKSVLLNLSPRLMAMQASKKIMTSTIYWSLIYSP